MAARRWQIEPFVGLAELRFGMSRAEIAKLLDPLNPVTGFSQQFDGSHREIRGLGLPFVTYRDDRTTEFESTATVAGLFLDEFEIFDHPAKDVMQFMAHRNGAAALGALGVIVFDAIGISTAGFYDEKSRTYFARGSDQDERSVTVYAKGGFDSLVGTLHPVSFPPD